MKLVEVQFPQTGPNGTGSPVKLELIRYLTTSFKDAVAARTNQIENQYRKWNQNYDAVPAQAIRSTPFNNASNFMPQLVKMHTDILTARVTGLILGTRPIWKCKSTVSERPSPFTLALTEFMQHISLYHMKFPELVDQICFRGFKTGTVVVKDFWQEDSRQTVSAYMDGRPTETTLWQKEFRAVPVAFEDFYPFPLTALNISQCEICFQRLRLTTRQVQSRKTAKVWDPDACDLLLTGPSPQGASASQVLTAQNMGISLTKDTGAPFDAIEAHLAYELEPGKKYELIAVFNPQFNTEKSLLRCYFRPDSDPFSQAFTDFRLFNTDKNFYCTAVPQILEDSQEEQAQIHNARRDASTIANVPGWKKKRYSQVADPNTSWYPGKVFEVDNMDDLVPLEFQTNYNSMVDEEAFLLQLAERYTGVTPAAQGQGSGVNGSTGYANTGTLAMISEGNRRQDTYIKRTRLPFHNIGKRAYTSYRDYGDPDVLIKHHGLSGQLVQQLFTEERTALHANEIFYDLGVTDAGANRETERSGLLLMANTMSAYYHELVQAAQMVSGTPDGTPAKELLLQVLDGARDLANRILFVFDIDSRESLLPDLRKVLGGAGAPGQGAGGPTGSAQSAALPPAQGPVSPDDLSGLAQQLATISGGGPERRPQ